MENEHTAWKNCSRLETKLRALYQRSGSRDLFALQRHPNLEVIERHSALGVLGAVVGVPILRLAKLEHDREALYGLA